MCIRCDGYSEEQAHRSTELSILTHGWALLGVVPNEDSESIATWTYTIGIKENFGLPELVVADHPYELAGHRLNTIASLLTTGTTRFELATEFGVRSQRVHPDHIGGEVFFGWFDYYAAMGVSMDEPRFLQILAPHPDFCSGHQPAVADLSDPHESFPANRPLLDT